MEAVFLILVGAALFSQSWHILGLYADGRTMAVYVGGMGLLSLAAIMFDTMLIDGVGDRAITPADHLAELTVMKALIAVWALYSIGVAAQALWDFEERAIGFYSAFLTVTTGVAFLYFATTLEPRYSDGVWLGLSAATLLLTIMSAMMFFALGFTFTVLRSVAGWFLLLGGGVVGVIGLAIAARAIS